MPKYLWTSIDNIPTPFANKISLYYLSDKNTVTSTNLKRVQDMANYIINKNQQPSGDYEVHNATTGCDHMPNPANQIDLGFHTTCHGAVSKAKRRWPNERINGCYYCCNPCHTT